MRLIDADAFIAKLDHVPMVQEAIRKAMDTMPTIEQSEIIRCKDCKHSRFFDPCFYCYEFGGEIIVPENGFCFMAERRKDGSYRQTGGN